MKTSFLVEKHIKNNNFIVIGDIQSSLMYNCSSLSGGRKTHNESPPSQIRADAMICFGASLLLIGARALISLFLPPPQPRPEEPGGCFGIILHPDPVCGTGDRLPRGGAADQHQWTSGERSLQRHWGEDPVIRHRDAVFKASRCLQFLTKWWLGPGV